MNRLIWAANAIGIGLYVIGGGNAIVDMDFELVGHFVL